MSFISDFHREAKRLGNRGRCLHFDQGERCNEIISAHSIQRRNQLGLIAEDGLVYRLNAEFSTLRKSGGWPQPKKKGIRKTSTFAGFCKHHDNELFKPIDNNPLEPNKYQIALYAYRSLCREYFVKENATHLIESIKQHPELDSDKQAFLNIFFTGSLFGFEGLKHHKHYYDDALRSKNYEEFEFTYFTSKSSCSMQLSGLLYPDFDFTGRHLQNLGNWSSPLDLITFFTAPTSDGWAFGFAWHVSSSRSCVPFLQSLASRVAGGDRVEDALFRFSVSCCENHAFRISWWDRLSKQAKQDVVERMHLSVNPIIPIPSDYLVSGCEGIADWNFDYVYTTLSSNSENPELVGRQ